ncbi:MAG: hypothetical protein A2Y10_17865 [Planctomycetes bacterium GWF2_41_51]|nr:MAG: hypothetical protein A2Y10_17865 [Planctomycetes bacterium GWF2_41_51]HBG25881.1 hypothetical protein [Phycisphaerales bacterium]
MHKWIVCVVTALGIFFISNCRASENRDANYGIICVSVANLRETPSHKAQLVDQEIMGYTIKLLKKQDNWCEVQTEYGYTGWMTDSSFCAMDEAKLKQWKESKKVRIVKVFATVYSNADVLSTPVTCIMMNVLLNKVETVIGGWIKVGTPDGRVGYLKTEDCVDAGKIDLQKEQLSKSIINTAKLMMGVPYLWGGKSSTANDCSGFTSTVFRANGINIGRDSRKQAVEGKKVDFKKDFSNVLPGDLLFFGTDRISHVAISLGGKEYIHQSGGVHINSFDPNLANYNKANHKKLKIVRRFF